MCEKYKLTKDQLDRWNGKKELTRMQDYGTLLKVFRQARYDMPPEDVQKVQTLLEKANLRIAMTATPHQIVARYLDKVARGVSRGETWENGKVRIHRYDGSFHIWDLTNAGKRGKKVDMMAVIPHGHRSDTAEWMEGQSKYLVLNARSYDSVKAYLKGLDPLTVDIHESQERGIDIVPGDKREIKLQWSVGDERLDLKASPLEFLLSSSMPLDRANPKSNLRQNTLYWHVKKADAAVFYGWLVDNEARIKTMGIMALHDLWHSLGVNFDSH